MAEENPICIRDISAAHDLRPWAAYILGRNSYSIGIRLRRHWEELYRGVESPDRSIWETFQAEHRGLDLAQWILIDKKLVVPRVLKGFSEAVGEVLGRFERLIDSHNSRERVINQGQVPPGQLAWEEALALSRVLIPIGNPDDSEIDELRLWRDLGEAVGGSLWAIEFNRPEDLSNHIQAIGKARDALAQTNKFPFLERALGEATDRPGFLPPVPSDQIPIDWPGRRYLPLRDKEIQDCLSRDFQPEPLLVLDKDELIFYERRHPYESKWKSEIGALWVLARRPGKRVVRKQIIEEAGIETTEEGLPPYFSRLKKSVSTKNSVRDYYGRRGEPLPKGLERDLHIVCRPRVKPPGERYVPYTLTLRPDQIKLLAPGPYWQESAT